MTLVIIMFFVFVIVSVWSRCRHTGARLNTYKITLKIIEGRKLRKSLICFCISHVHVHNTREYTSFLLLISNPKNELSMATIKRV